MASTAISTTQTPLVEGETSTTTVAGLGVGVASFNLGSGLTEIAALTALLGSSTAEALVLGNNGAAGLPWAFMSNFGALSILKACLAAATPDWLRDTVGVRTKGGDASLGLGLDLDKENVAKRLRIGNVVGLTSERTQEGDATGTRKAMHIFDTITTHIVATSTETKSLTTLHAHIFKTDPHFDTRLARITNRDILLLGISTIKLSEAVVLSYFGAGWFSLVSCAGWAAAIVCALIIQCMGLSRTSGSQIDIISGMLPTPLHEGSECRLLLGVPKAARLHGVWRIVWTILGLVCLTTVIGSYLLLTKLPNTIGFIWTGFQVVWLILRSLAYHLGHGTETLFQHPPIQRLPWESTPSSAKDRVRELVFALSTYQVQTHPRGVWSYAGDLNSLAAFQALQVKCQRPGSHLTTMTTTPAYSGPVSEKSATFSILAVIGDTALSSASYASGSKLSDLEIFDSCLVVAELPDGTIEFIPTTRVLSDRPMPIDTEKNALDERFFPRGGSSTAERARWWYWIPTTTGSWLQITCPVAGVCGTQQARVLTDEQLAAQLVNGELYISLRSVSEIKDIAKTAATASAVMLALMQ